MRVITGSARGRKLKTLDGQDVRPTTDKVKEAVFSIIQFQVKGADVLDVFAGSGQMGIEALSRGAHSAVFLDASKKACEVIRDNLAGACLDAGAQVICTNSLGYLSNCRYTFDIAFLDPPYRQGLLEQTLPLLEDKMNASGKVICEHEGKLVLPEQAGRLLKRKHYRYGTVEVTVYEAAETIL